MFTRRHIIKISTTILLHILFWCGVLLFYTYFFSFGSKDVSYILSFSLFLMPITIATTYVSIYKLIPDYLINKKYLKFALYSIYTLIISTYLIVVSVFFGLVYLSNFDSNNMAPISKNLLFVAIAVYMIVILVSAFKLLKMNVAIAKQTKNLETKILNTELQLHKQQLDYLKMQIHPHFLFNTLNTLYGFALQKSNQTPEMILKLSNLLDYLLYQTNKPAVFLIDELQHIEDYIALEKMRFNNTLNISLDVDITARNSTIPPMLLLPFVENSFKHGGIIDGKLDITIQLHADAEKINFRIKNSKKSSTGERNGIGLDNIKKRLLLLYPNRHELIIDKSKDAFTILLTLNLTAS